MLEAMPSHLLCSVIGCILALPTRKVLLVQWASISSW